MNLCRTLLLRLVIVLTGVALVAPCFASTRSQTRTASARGGISGSGGGTICMNSPTNAERPLLLDLTRTGLILLDTDKETGRLVGPWRYLEPMPLHLIDRVMREVHIKLRAWHKVPQSKELAELIETTFEMLTFFKFGCSLKDTRMYDLSGHNQCSLLQPAAMMFDGFVFIDKNIWNSIGFSSKVALLIHETLRFMQMKALALPQFVPSNQELQDLTFKIFTGPQPGSQLLTDPFFSPYLAENLELNWTVLTNMRSLLNNYRDFLFDRRAEAFEVVFDTLGMRRPEIHNHYIHQLFAEVDRLHDKTKACQ